MAPSAIEKPTLNTIGIPNGKSDSDMDSKIASPTDSENAEKNMAALEKSMNGKLEISTDTAAHDPLVNDASVTSASATSPPDLSADPLSATAMVSPLHTVNWDAIMSKQGQSLNSIVDTSMGGSGSKLASWEVFKRAGPRYPPSLEKLIMDYHHKNSKSWQLAHDMGAGSGVYSPTLARYFRHVHVSDPSKAGLAASKQLMSAWSAENKKSRGRFTFATAIPEEGHESVADRTVDMVIMMEGAHFTSPESMIRSAAQTLAKDGTLALVTYSPICRITGNPRAEEAVQRLFEGWGTAPWNIVCGEARGQKQFSLGLDFVPLPEDLFDQSKTRRITINTAHKGAASFQVPGAPASDASDSRVHKTERKHEYSSEAADEQAKGWRQEVGPEFFRSMTSALMGASTTHQFEENLQEIQKVVHETSPNGIMITVEWTVAVLLATRK